MKPKLMFSMYGVTSAMSAKCSLLHDAKKREWVPKTAANKKIVAAYQRHLPELGLVECLKTSSKIEGHYILLCSIFQNNVHWMEKGVTCQLGVGKGVELTSGFAVLSTKIAVLLTKSGDYVWLVKGELEVDNIKLHEKCTSIFQQMRDKEFTRPLRYDGIRFPKVSGKMEQSVKDTLSIETCSKQGEIYRVIKCLQDCMFEMDTAGAEVRARTEILLTKGLRRPQKEQKKFFTVDGPFTVFLTSQKLSEPYFVAVFA